MGCSDNSIHTVRNYQIGIVSISSLNRLSFLLWECGEPSNTFLFQFFRKCPTNCYKLQSPHHAMKHCNSFVQNISVPIIHLSRFPCVPSTCAHLMKALAGEFAVASGQQLPGLPTMDPTFLVFALFWTDREGAISSTPSSVPNIASLTILEPNSHLSFLSSLIF